MGSSPELEQMNAEGTAFRIWHVDSAGRRTTCAGYMAISPVNPTDYDAENADTPIIVGGNEDRDHG